MKVPLATLVRAFVYAICAYGLAATVVRFLRSTLAHANIRKRRALLSKLGCTVDDKILVGLFHPYWYAYISEKATSADMSTLKQRRRWRRACPLVRYSLSASGRAECRMYRIHWRH